MLISTEYKSLDEVSLDMKVLSRVLSSDVVEQSSESSKEEQIVYTSTQDVDWEIEDDEELVDFKEISSVSIVENKKEEIEEEYSDIEEEYDEEENIEDEEDFDDYDDESIDYDEEDIDGEEKDNEEEEADLEDMEDDTDELEEYTEDTLDVTSKETIEVMDNSSNFEYIDNIENSKINSATSINNEAIYKDFEKPSVKKTEDNITSAETNDIPSNIVDFVRKFRYCEISFARGYFSQKEIDRAILTGRIFKTNNKLYI